MNNLNIQDWTAPGSNVSMIVMKGSGDKAFCAGGDIKGIFLSSRVSKLLLHHVILLA